MKNNNPARIIAVAPSTRGFGFVVMENGNLIDWGVKAAKGDKNAQCLAKIEKLFVHYRFNRLVLEDYNARGSCRAPRIKTLGREIVALAESHKVKVATFSRKRVKQTFFDDGKGTKHDIARIVADRFSEELGSRLPPERRAWMSEHYAMSIFEAVALAVVFRTQMRK
jgi:Holliday junction resolvasome RuvABC endonuclease subunit